MSVLRKLMLFNYARIVTTLCNFASLFGTPCIRGWRKVSDILKSGGVQVTIFTRVWFGGVLKCMHTVSCDL